MPVSQTCRRWFSFAVAVVPSCTALVAWGHAAVNVAHEPASASSTDGDAYVSWGAASQAPFLIATAPSCTPVTCAKVGRNCGSIGDGCGGTLNCGTCTSPNTCGGGGQANRCSCTPVAQTTACSGRNCGQVSDGCFGSYSCGGACTGSSTCGGGGTPNVCGCETDAAFCARLGKNCGSVSGTDRCGVTRTVTCGTCPSTQRCGGGGTANVCGCESNATFCTRWAASCGSVTGTDNCGQIRTVATCGTCTAPKTCGGSGASGVCGCTPSFTCADEGYACGSPPDDCGGKLSCGACPSGQTCSNGYTCVPLCTNGRVLCDGKCVIPPCLIQAPVKG